MDVTVTVAGSRVVLTSAVDNGMGSVILYYMNGTCVLSDLSPADQQLVRSSGIITLSPYAQQKAAQSSGTSVTSSQQQAAAAPEDPWTMSVGPDWPGKIRSDFKLDTYRLFVSGVARDKWWIPHHGFVGTDGRYSVTDGSYEEMAEMPSIYTIGNPLRNMVDANGHFMITSTGGSGISASFRLGDPTATGYVQPAAGGDPTLLDVAKGVIGGVWDATAGAVLTKVTTAVKDTAEDTTNAVTTTVNGAVTTVTDGMAAAADAAVGNFTDAAKAVVNDMTSSFTAVATTIAQSLAAIIAARNETKQSEADADKAEAEAKEGQSKWNTVLVGAVAVLALVIVAALLLFKRKPEPMWYPMSPDFSNSSSKHASKWRY